MIIIGGPLLRVDTQQWRQAAGICADLTHRLAGLAAALPAIGARAEAGAWAVAHPAWVTIHTQLHERLGEVAASLDALRWRLADFGASALQLVAVYEGAEAELTARFLAGSGSPLLRGLGQLPNHFGSGEGLDVALAMAAVGAGVGGSLRGARIPGLWTEEQVRNLVAFLGPTPAGRGLGGGSAGGGGGAPAAAGTAAWATGRDGEWGSERAAAAALSGVSMAAAAPGGVGQERRLYLWMGEGRIAVPVTPGDPSRGWGAGTGLGQVPPGAAGAPLARPLDVAAVRDFPLLAAGGFALGSASQLWRWGKERVGALGQMGQIGQMGQMGQIGQVGQVGATAGPNQPLAPAPASARTEAPPTPAGVRELAENIAALDSAQDHGHFRILRHEDGSGKRSFSVIIRGTQSWQTDSANPQNLAANLAGVAGLEADQANAVLAGMSHAGIRPGDPVEVVGHSQGGIIAARIVSDPLAAREFNYTTLTTFGSPVQHIPTPGVDTLHVAQIYDPVPALDATPDRFHPQAGATPPGNFEAGTDGAVHVSVYSPTTLPGKTPHDLAGYAAIGGEIDSFINAAGGPGGDWPEAGAPNRGAPAAGAPAQAAQIAPAEGIRAWAQRRRARLGLGEGVRTTKLDFYTAVQ